MPEKKNDTVFLTILLVIALVARMIAINQSFWLDEAINVMAARDRSLIELVRAYSVGDFHPPLYHLILWSWFRLVTVTELTARLPSVLFGVATVFLMYRTAIELKSAQQQNRFVARLTSFLLAISGLHIYYSQEARMYSLAAFFAIATLWSLLRLFQRKTRSRQIIYLATLAITLMTDYQPWLLLPLLLILEPTLTTVAVLSTVPWWSLISKQVETGLTVAASYPVWRELVGGLTVKSLILVPIKFLVGRVSLDNNFLYAAALTVPGLASLIALSRLLPQKGKDLLLIAWMSLPLTLGALLALWIPIFTYFRFLFLLPVFYLLLAIGTERLSPRVKSAVTGIVLITTMISSAAYLTSARFQREDWKAASSYLKEFDPQRTLVVFPNRAQAAGLEYYNGGRLEIQDKESLKLTGDVRDVFLVRYVGEIFDPNQEIPRTLEETGYRQTNSLDFPGILIWQYSLTRDSDENRN